MTYKFSVKEKDFPFVLGACAASLAFLLTLFRGVENLGISDAHDYVDQARGMLKGASYMFANPNSFQHGLGFSWTIALTFLVSNSSSLLLFKALLSIGHGFSTFMVAKIGGQIGLGRRYWTLAAILFALDPFVLLTATDIQTESITTLIVLYWSYLYIRPREFSLHQKSFVMLFALSGCYSVLIRPNSILPFIFVACILYFRWYREGIGTTWIGLSISLFIGIVGIFEVFITRLYSAFVFLSPVGGVNAEFMCRSEFIPQYLGFASASQNAKINALISTSQSSELLHQHPGLSVAQINHDLWNVGISTCLNHPIESIWVIFLKTLALWRPFTVYGAYGSKVFVATFLLWVPLTLVTAWYLLNRKLTVVNIRLRNYFIVMSVGFTLSLLLTPTQIRHRVAFAEPFYWLFATYFLQWILERRNSIKIRED